MEHVAFIFLVVPWFQKAAPYFPIQVLGKKQTNQTHETGLQRKQQSDKGRRRSVHRESESFHMQQMVSVFPKEGAMPRGPLWLQWRQEMQCFVLFWLGTCGPNTKIFF